jgi:hypothetical protein
MIYLLLIGGVVGFAMLVRAQGKRETAFFDELRGAGFSVDEVYRMSPGMLVVDRQNRKVSFSKCSGYLNAPLETCGFPLLERGFKKSEHRFSFDDVVGGELTKIVDPNPKYQSLSVGINVRRYRCRQEWLKEAPECLDCYYRLWGSTHEVALPRFLKLFKDDFDHNIEVTEKPFLERP